MLVAVFSGTISLSADGNFITVTIRTLVPGAECQGEYIGTRRQ
jgi:hypothetical protein